MPVAYRIAPNCARAADALLLLSLHATAMCKLCEPCYSTAVSALITAVHTMHIEIVHTWYITVRA
jgi:hypothetical protein